MNVTSIRMQGFRSYADCTIHVPKGTVGVVGDNGAGKSTLMEAIYYALFGGSASACTREGDDRMLVEVHIEHSGDTYRIRRSAVRSRTALDFDIQVGDGWEPLTQGTQTDTQDVIARVLGVSKATFLHSVFLRQNEGGSFPKADPKDRREILSSALGLDIYAEALKTVSTDRKQAEKRVAELTGRADVLGEGLDQLDIVRIGRNGAHEQVVAATATLEQAERAAREATERVVALNEAGAAWHRQAALVREADGLLDRMRDQLAAARAAELVAQGQAAVVADLERQLADLEDVTDRLNGAYQQQQLHDEAVVRRDGYLQIADVAEVMAGRANDTIIDILGRLDRLDAEAPTCDQCGQHVSGEALARTRKSLKDAYDGATLVFQEEVTKAQANRGAADAVNLPAPPDPATVRALEEQRDRHQTVGVDLAVARERLAAAVRQSELGPDAEDVEQQERLAIRLHADLAAIPAPDDDATATADRDARDALAHAHASRARLAQLRDEHVRLDEQTKQLEQRHTQLAGVVVERDGALGELEELRVLDQAFGPAGVPAWIVEHNAIPAIEQHANAVLDRLGGAVRRVELRTERETKDGTAKATLDVVCHTDQGARDFRTFSGGEQTRADLALRLGLAQLLAGRRSDVRLLCLDEPAGLDAAGMEALVGVLRDLTVSGRVETVLLASHVSALRDAFDQAIFVQRADEGSRAVVC